MKNVSIGSVFNQLVLIMHITDKGLEVGPQAAGGHEVLGAIFQKKIHFYVIRINFHTFEELNFSVSSSPLPLLTGQVKNMFGRLHFGVKFSKWLG